MLVNSGAAASGACEALGRLAVTIRCSNALFRLFGFADVHSIGFIWFPGNFPRQWCA